MCFLVGCANLPEQNSPNSPENLGKGSVAENPATDAQKGESISTIISQDSTGAGSGQGQTPETSRQKATTTKPETTPQESDSSKIDGMDSQTSQVIPNIEKLENSLGELQKEDTELQTEQQKLENLPLIKRIEELFNENQSLQYELSVKKQKKEQAQHVVSSDEYVETMPNRAQNSEQKKNPSRTVVGKKRHKRPKKSTAKRPISKPKKTKKYKKPTKTISKPRKKPKSVGRGRIVVVSLSTFSRGQQKAIRNSFFEVLKAKKRKSNSFTLYTIQSGRQSRALLTSSQLRRLPVEGGSHSILGKLETGMRFGARDLKALADLSRLIKSKRNKIGRVLYITDNKRIDAANQKQRNILLEWKKAGGRLTVLTSGSCSVWKQFKASCRALGSLKGTLRGFM